MVQESNASILDEKQNVTEADMRRFVGIMFAMTVSPKSNIRHYGTVKDVGFKVADRFSEKLPMA